MDCEQLKGSANVETARLKLLRGWKATVVLSGLSDTTFSADEWGNCLARPESILEDYEQILKQQDQNLVVVKSLTLAGRDIKVVIKRHYPNLTLRSFFRSFRRGRALRNFNTAIELLGCDVPVAIPLAAIEQKRFGRSIQSIYVTEYIENGDHLHHFLTQLPAAVSTEAFKLKKQLCVRIAQALAALHRSGYWHRDAKATNFIVSKDTFGRYRLLMTDMDGIKPYRLRKRYRQLRAFWHLAASLMHLHNVTRTDCLRTFTAYCKLLCISARQRRDLFRRIAAEADAKYARSLRNSAAQKQR